MNDLKIKYYDEEIDIFNEVLMVSKTTFTATLSRIPSNRKILISHGYTSLTEVDTEPNINEFKVDRNTGEILFNSAMAGEKLIADYHAIGKFCVSADNVSTNVDSNGNVIETLEGYLQKNKEIIDSVNTIGDGATVFNQLEAHIESAKNLMGNVIEGGNVNDKLVKTINNSKKADTNLNESINSANTKITEMNEWVDQHGDIVNLDNRVDGVEAHIPKINEQLADIEKQKATLQECKEEIAKAQLEGAGVDTSNFVVQTELETKTVELKKDINNKMDLPKIFTEQSIVHLDGLYSSAYGTCTGNTTGEYMHVKFNVTKGDILRIISKGTNSDYCSICGVKSNGARVSLLDGDTTVKTTQLEFDDTYEYIMVNTNNYKNNPIRILKCEYVNKNTNIIFTKKVEDYTTCKIKRRYSKNKDLMILFTNYDNNNFKMSHLYLTDNLWNDNPCDFLGASSDTQYLFLNSEWLSPYENLLAKNNPLSQIVEGWVGGSHKLGSLVTIKNNHIKFYCDDKEILSDNSIINCNEVKIIISNDIYGTNTCTSNESRAVLREIQTWIINDKNIDVKNQIEILEDCSLKTCYGLQSENHSHTLLCHYGDSENLGNLSITQNYLGSNKLNGICNGWKLENTNGDILEVIIDNQYDFGNRGLINIETPTVVSKNYKKTYSYIVDTKDFKKGDKFSYQGGYKFYYSY